MLRKKSEMSDEMTKAEADANNRTLTDEQVVTKRKLTGRKFFTAAGVLLASGALTVAASAQAAQTPDPDKAKSSTAGTATQKAPDPDKKKAADPDKKKTHAKKDKKDNMKPGEKPSDPDAKK